MIFKLIMHLAGAALLLLFAVSMVRTGIERAFGSSFRRLMKNSKARIKATFAGMALAAIMQSSVAVAVLLAGFVGSGVMSFQTGMAAMLGADLGAALIIQFLSIDVGWIAPLLLIIGGVMFLKSQSMHPRQIGRALLGIALILIALEMIRTTILPIRDSQFLPDIAALLEHDFLTTFLLGAVLTLMMQSSLAAVLMCVAFVAIDALPLMVGLSLMLGANLGSSLLPLWMTKAMMPAARQVPLINAILKGSMALLMVFIVHKTALIAYLPDISDDQLIILGHIIFNLLLLGVALPFIPFLAHISTKMLARAEAASQVMPPHYRSVLEPDMPDNPKLALASVRREIQRMLIIVEEMMLQVMELFEHYTDQKAKTLLDQDKMVNAALNGTRLYVTELSGRDDRQAHRKELRNLLEFGIAIEAAGDLVSKTLSHLAASKNREQIHFSKEGLAELQDMHDQVMANIATAANLLVSGDVDIARQLLEEKVAFTHRQRNSRKSHLKRLSKGRVESLESSDLHLETALAFKEFNSHIASIAYPILQREGQLLGSRLINKS